MYQTQLTVEETYSKKNIPVWIKQDIGDLNGNPNYQQCVVAVREYLGKEYFKSKDERIAKISMEPEEIAVELFYSVLSTLDSVTPIQAVATMLGHRIGLEQLDAVKCGAEILAVCKDAGVYEILHAFSPEHDHDTAVIKPFFKLEDETLQKIHMAMYLPPMTCEPRPWTDNRHGGLLLEDSSAILGEQNYHGMKQSLDVLNKLQSIAWELNTCMLAEKELPKETGDITDPVELRKIEQHNARCAQSDRVYQYELDNENQFYFVWKFDKRGRQYSQGYDINLQGSEYKKAILQFAKAEILTGVA